LDLTNPDFTTIKVKQHVAMLSFKWPVIKFNLAQHQAELRSQKLQQAKQTLKYRAMAMQFDGEVKSSKLTGSK
jgi:hypothetical protein